MTQFKYWTNVTGCLDVELRTPVNNWHHKRLLFYKYNYNNIFLFKPVIF